GLRRRFTRAGRCELRRAPAKPDRRASPRGETDPARLRLHLRRGRAARSRPKRLSYADRYAFEIARSCPGRFEWAASIHPYRDDCIEALEWAAAHGARMVKWLPSAMGI